MGEPSTVWLIALVVLVAGEAITVGLTFIWFALGALGGLIAAWLGAPVWAQVVIFLAVSALALVLSELVRQAAIYKEENDLTI